MKNTFIAIIINTVLMQQSCTETHRKDNHNMVRVDSVLNKNIKEDTLSFFDIFSNKFEYRQLPFESKIGSKDWKDFSSKAPLIEIPRDTAILYLTAGNKNVFDKKSDGYHQYYYGYKINFNNVIMLIYYRTSLDYVGYVISTFDKLGKLQDTLFLSGVKGEYDPEAQKDGVIGSDGLIEISEIIMNQGIDYSGRLFKADYLLKKYQVNPQGKIVEIYNLSKLGVDVKCEKTQKDRVVLID
jgi:hypothetical protein